MEKKKKRVWVRRLFFATAVLTLRAAAAFYTGLTVRRYVLQSDALAPGTSLRIVLLADLHSTIYGENQKPLIDAIRREKPDLILLAGDIVDDRIPIDGTLMLLGGLCGGAPIYYVPGNHEYRGGEIDTIRHKIRTFGVTILSDSYLTLDVGGNKILLAGVEDPGKKTYADPAYDRHAAMRGAFSDLGSEPGYKILLAHRPENIGDYKNYPFDLVLSGHAHGGQVRIPFLVNGLFAPNQGWFPQYAGGRYNHGALTHIVSRGLSIKPMLPRIFNPPELVVITVAPAR